MIGLGGQSMNWKKTVLYLLGGLVIVISSVCGPSQSEMDATATQLASSVCRLSCAYWLFC